MVAKFNRFIAIGVSDKERAAEDFCALFSASVTDRRDDWVEVTAGPFLFYFVEEGNRDIAFSVDVADHDSALAEILARGFTLDRETTERVGETFVLSPDGMRINLTVAPSTE
ncbi:MAG TPA: hypothetical protein PLL78_06175 [Fimbriimonadaceae bacterium]|nr:hypothetical protein [Fimbriimonadaceae bacterium]HRJ96254.1 hypothetical protein [Fimbriimonadaceae bacterium]